MKYSLLFFLILMLIAQLGSSQNVLNSDSLKRIDAPDSLKKLIEEIKHANEQTKSDADIEIDGLLFDETKTKSGRDFYDLFYSQWEAPEGAKNYSIVLTEKPYRLSTTLIEIGINETTVFQSLLQPKAELIEQLALEAVIQTQLYLANIEELTREFAGEDKSGTGIY